MIATETAQHKFSIAPSTLLLASNKEIAAKVLTWDMGMWGTGMGYSADEIQCLKLKGDILRFELTGGRAVHISADAFVRYWDSIRAYEAQMEAQDEAQATDPTVLETVTVVYQTTVEVFSDSDTELDVIELEIGGYVETRLGYIEEDWEGVLTHHIFFEPYDNEELWLAAYRKSSERGSSRVEAIDDDVEYISQLEEALCYADLAGW